jgi:hypothetical protein
MDTFWKLLCVALFIPAMWAVYALAKLIVLQLGVVEAAIAFAALFAAACIMDRRG